jgi:hypothetical protein
MYAQLVPLALEREQQLLAALSPPERRAFLGALERLETDLGL